MYNATNLKIDEGLGEALENWAGRKESRIG
jgi:hypothetical protein